MINFVGLSNYCEYYVVAKGYPYMTDDTYITHSHDIHLDKDYDKWLSELISRYRKAQVKAAVKVNSEKLLWNWQMGRDLVQRKAEERWGSGIVEQVSLDLQAAFPGDKGFGSGNLWYMKRWYSFYESKLKRLIEETASGHTTILQRTVEEFKFCACEVQNCDTRKITIDMPMQFGLLPWGQHIEIISRCETLPEALFYINKTIEDSLSRPALIQCIKAHLYHIKGGAISNFADKLPMPQAQLVQEITKENYDFSFVSLPEKFAEKQLEDALCNQMTKFLLELGTGFAFMGRQREIVVAGRSRFIDLLFYHIRLRSYIILEIKAKPFEPEFAGKLNFYVNAVNDLLKTPDDNPSIGLLICSDLKNTEVQYAFQGISTPMGVASYSNVRLEEIKNLLPTIEQLQERISLLEAQIMDQEKSK